MDYQSVRYELTARCTETLDTDVDNERGSTILSHGWDTAGIMRSGLISPIGKSWSDTRDLTAGADAIDLTSLSRGNLTSVDMTDLRIYAVKVTASSDNSAAILIQQGDTNPYYLLGAAGGNVTLPAGSSWIFFAPEKLAFVSATAKSLKVTSSDEDASYQIAIVGGADLFINEDDTINERSAYELYVSQLFNQYTSLASRVTVNEGDIDSLEGDVSALQGTVAALNLQAVTDIGSSTTNAITAAGFISNGDISLRKGDKLIFDSDDGSDSYWTYNDTDDTLDAHVDGTRLMALNLTKVRAVVYGSVEAVSASGAGFNMSEGGVTDIARLVYVSSDNALKLQTTLADASTITTRMQFAGEQDATEVGIGGVSVAGYTLALYSSATAVLGIPAGKTVVLNRDDGGDSYLYGDASSVLFYNQGGLRLQLGAARTTVFGTLENNDATAPGFYCYETGVGDRVRFYYDASANRLVTMTPNAAGSLISRITVAGEQDAWEVGVGGAPVAGYPLYLYANASSVSLGVPGSKIVLNANGTQNTYLIGSNTAIDLYTGGTRAYSAGTSGNSTFFGLVDFKRSGGDVGLYFWPSNSFRAYFVATSSGFFLYTRNAALNSNVQRFEVKSAVDETRMGLGVGAKAGYCLAVTASAADSAAVGIAKDDYLAFNHDDGGDTRAYADSSKWYLVNQNVASIEVDSSGIIKAVVGLRASSGDQGIDQVMAIEDNGGTTHNLTFVDGLLTTYSTS